MKTIAVTGAGGFVGRSLLSRLSSSACRVIAIARRPPSDYGAPAGPGKLEWVAADLLESEKLEDVLRSVDCVIHLAARTGKARAEAYWRDNVQATEALVAACERAGVKRFIFVSSIAAGFRDRRFYPYAESKIVAEQRVASSRLPNVIVRPTMIMGAGSPIEAGLSKLARLPVIPMFGSGSVRVQPVSVDEVVDVLTQLIDAEELDGNSQTLEVGGSRICTMKELMAALRSEHGIRGKARFLHLPLTLLRYGLASVEKPLFPLLPFTAGQLASFANDAVAGPRTSAVEVNVAAAAPAAISEAEARLLEREHGSHARYLFGQQASAYQAGKYVDFHRRQPLMPGSGFDRILVSLARSGSLGLRLADAYTGFFFRSSVVRAKLAVTLAILECSAPSFQLLDAPLGNRVVAPARFAWEVATAGFTLLAASLVLAPVHLWCALSGRGRPAEAR